MKQDYPPKYEEIPIPLYGWNPVKMSVGSHFFFFFFVYPLIFASNQLIQWDPPTSVKVDDSKLDLLFQPFKDDLELQIPENEEHGSA